MRRKDIHTFGRGAIDFNAGGGRVPAMLPDPHYHVFISMYLNHERLITYETIREAKNGGRATQGSFARHTRAARNTGPKIIRTRSRAIISDLRKLLSESHERSSVSLSSTKFDPVGHRFQSELFPCELCMTDP